MKRLSHRPTRLKAGSHYYYENPGAEKGSAWGGENVMYLGDGEFYAHGIVGEDGSYIVTEREILDTLSALRMPGSRKKPKRVNLELHMDAAALAQRATQEPAT